MTSIFFIGIAIALAILLIIMAFREMYCSYVNPAPLFHNGDKRFHDIIHSTDLYKTRSILKDMKYGI